MWGLWESFLFYGIVEWYGVGDVALLCSLPALKVIPRVLAAFFNPQQISLRAQIQCAYNGVTERRRTTFTP